MVGTNKHPIRCILLTFDEIVKIPNEVEVMKMRIAMSFPSSVGSEKVKIIIIRIVRIIFDSFSY